MSTAVKAFQLEFDATPGLMKDAYDYFGDDCSTHATLADSDNAFWGCNGDLTNDRCINNDSTTCNVAGTLRGDIRRFFLHLNISGIMPDLPAITDTTSFTDCSIGSALPKVPIGGTYWVSSEDPGKIFMYFFEPPGLQHTGIDCILNGGGTSFFPPRSYLAKDVKRIDEKLDDGHGARGKLKTIYEPTNNNYTDSYCFDYTDDSWEINLDEKRCGFRVEIQ
jgi:hypothetical protein